MYEDATVNAIVTTTINPPTKAIRLFDEMKDWRLIVAGDKKTPPDYRLNRGTYIPPKEQEAYDKGLSDAIGWNCIQRRNFGVLWAYDMGAEVVALVDDDNIPYDDWGKDLMVGRHVEVNYYETELPAFDPVGATNMRQLWHRGFPLPLVSRRIYHPPSKRVVYAPLIQADFWNGSPDIDAICRMEHAPECTFRPPILSPGGQQDGALRLAEHLPASGCAEGAAFSILTSAAWTIYGQLLRSSPGNASGVRETLGLPGTERA